MSLSTSYRFEVISEKKGLKSALHKQQQRIQEDEMMAERQRQAKLEQAITLKSNWNEALAAVANVKKVKAEMRQQREDLRMSQRATIMVRQAALRQLLDSEYREYERQLHAQGKAFYIKRT